MEVKILWKEICQLPTRDRIRFKKYMQLYLDDRNHARDVGTVGETKNCKLEPVTNHAE